MPRGENAFLALRTQIDQCAGEIRDIIDVDSIQRTFSEINLDVVPVSPSYYHVTYFFFGERLKDVSGHVATQIRDKIAAFASKLKRTTLKFQRFALLPPGAHKKLVAVFEPTESLRALYEMFQDLRVQGPAHSQGTGWCPHLTLATFERGEAIGTRRSEDILTRLGATWPSKLLNLECYGIKMQGACPQHARIGWTIDFDVQQPSITRGTREAPVYERRSHTELTAMEESRSARPGSMFQAGADVYSPWYRSHSSRESQHRQSSSVQNSMHLHDVETSAGPSDFQSALETSGLSSMVGGNN